MSKTQFREARRKGGKMDSEENKREQYADDRQGRSGW